MSVELSPRERAERQVQEEAQALVARGQLVPAVRSLDAFLAANDGDWGLWLYTAGLYARLGLKGQAIAAYRASSRQLEDAGLYARARAALVLAAPLDPQDASLARDVQRLSRRLPQDPADQTCLLEAVSHPAAPPRSAPRKRTVVARRAPQRAAPRPSPSIDLRPRTGPDPFSLLDDAPNVDRPTPTAALDPKPARPSALHLRARGPNATDPHLAIFDILDAERASRG